MNTHEHMNTKFNKKCVRVPQNSNLISYSCTESSTGHLNFSTTSNEEREGEP